MEITFLLRGIFPRDLPCPVTVQVNGKTLLHKTYRGEQLRDHRKIGPIRVAPELNRGWLDVGVQGCAWQPSKHTSSTDTRTLGLDVHGIRIRTLPKP